ncbi:hypothetical protein L210DRAFT_3503231 [Boletus edulis BED1]|uniref:Uncharacterized protein n=1 Tax=Boletus edulis BED1 TaxID=1328754 RepID=A0AAD4BWZ3_BOLED|nr:hypothetical protein L210DRAFT_3503231 [Boletus edulis BED1]
MGFVGKCLMKLGAWCLSCIFLSSQETEPQAGSSAPGKAKLPSLWYKIQSDDAGSLSIKKKTFRLRRDPEKKTESAGVGPPSSDLDFDVVTIPEAINNLPESVDLTILDSVPRQRTISVNLRRLSPPRLDAAMS